MEAALLVPPRRSDTASKLPSYRLIGGKASVMGLINPQYDISPPHGLLLDGQQRQQEQPKPPPAAVENTFHSRKSDRSTAAAIVENKENIVESKPHRRHHSANNIKDPKSRDRSPSRPKTSASEFATVALPTSLSTTTTKITSTPAQNPHPNPHRSYDNQNPRPKASRRTTTSKVPASNSRRDVEWEGPPPAMITGRSFLPFETSTTSSTTQNWVESQSPSTDQIGHSPTSPNSPRSPSEGTPVRPKIQPIRGFKPSSRRSTDMAAKRNSTIDPDSTIRAIEGFESHRSTQPSEHEEQNSDESDLFLRAAREEEFAQRGNVTDRLIRSDRRSQIGQRSSVPPSSNTSQPSTTRRRGSDNEVPRNFRSLEDQDGVGQALTSRPSIRDRPSALDDINKSRYYGSNSRSNPTTPRTMTSNREVSPESQVSYSGRRPSIPENNSSRGSSYRQSNLSYSTPRTYNSSPLVSRTADVQIQEDTETPRATEGTNSTVSTTAPSTMWDELDELKSRIHRLELTGKLPATSGAAMSRVSSDRPPTATTTVTTISSSPKRGRNNSISPIDSALPEAPEHHPLLHAALEKSRPLLHPDIFRALEAATSDALAISQMMGTTGQPGPMSAQSTVGTVSGISDRQVRRKADSMCRSLTELCLALSDARNDQTQAQNGPLTSKPTSRDGEIQQSIEAVPNSERLGMANDLLRAKSSPRSFSRLEARRSSLLTGSTLPAPRFNMNDNHTPTQSAMSNRRTSLLLRSTRRGTEEPEEDDDLRFRAPSRATTEIGRIRNSPREYINQPKFSERLNDRYADRLPERGPIRSNLPIRRTYTSASSNNTPPSMPPVSNLGGRRFLDRNTPERDMTTNSGVTSRLVEDRAQRKALLSTSSALPARTNSLSRKTRQGHSHSADMSAGQHGNNGYQ